MALIGNLDTRRNVNASWRGYVRGDDDESHQQLEKALHRFVVVGVVSDYTVNYASREFNIRVSGATKEEVADSVARYVGAYQRGRAETARAGIAALEYGSHREFIEAVLRQLTEFIYDTIERARRRSLLEMLNAATQGGGQALRARILSYLQTSEFDEALDAVVNNSLVGGLDQLSPLLDGVATPTEAAGLRGAVGRYLRPTRTCRGCCCFAPSLRRWQRTVIKTRSAKTRRPP